MPNWFPSLADWSWLDTRIVITAGLAAMACALPGNFLLLRRQSMMGDALSHAVLLGIAVAFLTAHGLQAAGILSHDSYDATRHAVMFVGAVVVGVLTAVLSETVRKLGNVEASAALGVVFLVLFALGLLLIRLYADRVHLDPDCVLYGTVETAAVDGRLIRVNGAMLAVNLLLVALLFKELRLAAFDPGLATTLGVNAGVMHYGLMAVTAATLVAAFETVGSILVIAMLIVPPATAYLLTQRLWLMVALSLVVAAASALLGHVAAIVLPPLVAGLLGWDSNVGASSAGMMAVAAGALFVVAVIVSPQQGLVMRVLRRAGLRVRIAEEDRLAWLYRAAETLRAQPATQSAAAAPDTAPPNDPLRPGWLWQQLALRRLVRRGQVQRTESGPQLTPSGHQAAQDLVRTHRLWESYLQRHFGDLPGERQHRSAHQMEHYISPEMREELAAELDRPRHDPHGQEIPPPAEQDSESL